MENKINLKQNHNLEDIAKTVKEWLDADQNWKETFERYAHNIHSQKPILKEIKAAFRKPRYLSLYTCINDISANADKPNKEFNIRYKGQSVAYIKKSGEKPLTLFADKTLNARNKLHFGWCNRFDDKYGRLKCEWRSPAADAFRRHFAQNRINPHNLEHRFENLLIEEFSKKHSADKKILNIQPVKIYDTFAFQMTTKLRASGNQIYKTEGVRAGGIDILARVKQGMNVNLCVIELKSFPIADDASAHIVRGQGLAYAVFLRELLRSQSGNLWYENFGYSQTVPEKLIINVCIAAPKSKNGYIPQEPNPILIGAQQDVLQFKYLFFETDKKMTKITSIDQDLFD